MNGIKAIETQYKGFLFRSRLEARWAVFFDALRVKWEYEKEGFEFDDGTRYLPDFWLPEHKLWVEVKGDNPTGDEIEKLGRVMDETENSGAFIVSDVPGRDCVTWSYFEDWEGICTYRKLNDLPELPISQDSASKYGKTAWKVNCPYCRGEEDYVHFGKVREQQSDDYTAWEGRGDAIRIPMYCEDGHEWTLLFGFHKGFTFTRIESGVEKDYDILTYLAGGDYILLTDATLKSRSARFEFGQTPT
jgi:hypothetical protein